MVFSVEVDERAILESNSTSKPSTSGVDDGRSKVHFAISKIKANFLVIGDRIVIVIRNVEVECIIVKERVVVVGRVVVGSKDIFHQILERYHIYWIIVYWTLVAHYPIHCWRIGKGIVTGFVFVGGLDNSECQAA